MGNFKTRLLAFKYAINGFMLAFKKEWHLKIHLMAFLVVLNLGFYFHVSNSEWFALLLSSALVISLELINSSIEALCDLIMPTKNEKIKYIKDVAAAAVLVAAIFALSIGLIIFLPRIM